MKKTFLILLAAAFVATTHAQVHITEFFYQGMAGDIGDEHEFFELTNLGDSAVDVTGWYYRDETGNPETPFSLSPFGSIAAGESVIVSDISEADFRSVWSGMDAEVRVLGGATPGLGRNDWIRIFDAGDQIVDQIDFGDSEFAGTGRLRWVTSLTTLANLGANDIYGWYFSGFLNEDDTPSSLVAPALVDALGNPVINLTSINGDIGNPGTFAVAVPEPSTVWLGAGILALVALRFRNRMRKSNA